MKATMINYFLEDLNQIRMFPYALLILMALSARQRSISEARVVRFFLKEKGGIAQNGKVFAYFLTIAAIMLVAFSCPIESAINGKRYSEMIFGSIRT